ncbi:hexosaminidase [Cellulosimicrobium aquatile]|uniref:Hexosaminidase n=1 Tax=Cellulosimicrobium aquatile TaxID=1612203 RepID=A0A1N6PR93_9MICO|nr:family 20 glycosylhydrolase [Cellulosimicrobium aquatile]SIQ06841.1 hexosaminidase [Cellulosimicrobium aquatile]
MSAALAVALVGALTVPAASAAPTGAPASAPAAVERAAADPPLPDVIPSLRDWADAAGSWSLAAGTQVATGGDDGLAGAADVLADELGALLDEDVPVVADPTAASVVDLAVDDGRTDLGKEGYALTVHAGGVTIVGATPQGAFYGTRTLAQMLAQQTVLPAGSTVDVPRYAERGVTLCACQINVSEEWIDRLLEEMASLKLNYLLVELKLKSTAHPETATWSYYTPEQLGRIVEKADTLGIDVIPEINSPGHMEIWLENKPELQLVDRNGVRDEVRLDITRPEAFDFYTDLLDEYLDVFTSDYWHMGADEYMITTGFQNFPQIEAYAKSLYGPSATPDDAFVAFVNKVNAYVKETHGKTLRIWNDGLVGRNTQPVDTDIVVEHWLGTPVSPQALLDAGHPVMNSSYALYLVRGGLKMNTRNLYDQRWDVGRFYGSTVDPAHPGLTGAKVSLWPDSAAAQTENSVEEEMFMPLRFIAQTTWTAGYAKSTYAEFEALARSIGRPAGWENVDRTPVEDGAYTLTTTDGDGLGATPAGSLAAGPDVRDGWVLTATADGYHTVRSTATGLCLDVVDGKRRLGVPVEIGVPVVASACGSSNIQKWQLLATDDGFAVVNASTRQLLSVDEDGTVVQLPPDMTGTVWTVEPAVAVDVAVETRRVLPGASATATVTVENTTDATLEGVAVAAQAPAGWTAPAAAQVGDLAPGADRTVTIALAPATGTWGLGRVPVAVTWTVGGQERSAGATVDLVAVSTAQPSRPVAVIDVDSEETQGEDGRAANAIDGNPATFWHTRWSGSAPTPPHHVALDTGAEQQLFGLTYTPRTGTGTGAANGRIGAYEIYVSTDGESWGEPVAAGSLPNVATPSTIGFAPTVGRYVKLVALREVNGNPWTTAAEIAVDGAPVVAQPTITAHASARCLAGKAYVAVTARNTGSAPADLTLRSAFGERTVTGVAPGASAYQSFASRTTAVDAGSAEVASASGTARAEFAALRCG